MQVPIGVSGVHAVPNTLHSHGSSDALEHLAALAGLRVGDPHPGTRKMPLGVERARTPRATACAECGDEARGPRHSKYGRSSITSPMTSSARRLPSHGTTRLYWFSTSQRPSRELEHQLVHGLQDVQRLEPGDDQRLAVLARR